MRPQAALRLIINPDPIEEDDNEDDDMTGNTTEAPQADCVDCGKRKSHTTAFRVAGIIAGAALMALVVIFLRLPAGDVINQGDEPAAQ